MVPLGVQFALATSASHVLARWASSGGVVASRIPSTPYPDERYQTKLMFWDRRTFAHHAMPRQATKTFAEMNALAHHLDQPAAIESLSGSIV